MASIKIQKHSENKSIPSVLIFILQLKESLPANSLNRLNKRVKFNLIQVGSDSTCCLSSQSKRFIRKLTELVV